MRAADNTYAGAIARGEHMGLIGFFPSASPYGNASCECPLRIVEPLLSIIHHMVVGQRYGMKMVCLNPLRSLDMLLDAGAAFPYALLRACGRRFEIDNVQISLIEQSHQFTRHIEVIHLISLEIAPER